jgi:nitroreductase
MKGFRPWSEYQAYAEPVMRARAQDFAGDMIRRRTIRDFSSRDVPESLIENCLRAATSAPSGANRQPWHFCVVTDPQLKRDIRLAAEAEERQFYEQRAPQAWLDDLAPLGTDADKPFLERAPYLIVIFAQRFEVAADGATHKNYYVSESVGIATGMLITALHHCGLATLTHTPSPMKFLRELLGRPRSERPFLILVTGYPAADAQVPEIERKPLTEVVSWNGARG